MAIVFVVVDGRSRSISFIVRTVLILTEGRRKEDQTADMEPPTEHVRASTSMYAKL